MRTTVTLESDVEHKLQELMRVRGLTFKQALNDTLRTGLGMTRGDDVSFPAHDLGEPLVDLTHALRLASAMEDEETLRKMAAGR